MKRLFFLFAIAASVVFAQDAQIDNENQSFDLVAGDSGDRMDCRSCGMKHGVNWQLAECAESHFPQYCPRCGWQNIHQDMYGWTCQDCGHEFNNSRAQCPFCRGFDLRIYGRDVLMCKPCNAVFTGEPVY